MKKINSILLDFVRIALNQNKDIDYSIHESEWPGLYNLILTQGMGSILFPVVEILPDESKPSIDIYDKWKTQLLYAAVVQLRKTQQIRNIVDTFKSVGLPFLIIKGPAIARFYKQPEYRLMGDLDILVEEKYIPLAQQTIESLGYILVNHEDDHPFHIEYAKQGDLYIELHYALVRSGLLDKKILNNWYQHIWEGKCNISFNDAEFHIMPIEDELIYQILHFMRHIVFGGINMRHIYDMALIIDQCNKELDWTYLFNMMNDLKIIKLGSFIFTIFNKYFDIRVPDFFTKKTQILPEAFIDGFFNDYFWLTRENLEYKETWVKLARVFPILCKSSKTLPLVFIIEFMRQLKRKNKKNMGELLLNTRNNMEYFANTNTTFRELGINW